jgi:menaquinone-specific isochorismate synthase
MRAVTEAWTAAIDLNDVARGDGVLFVREGVGLAGRGVAWRGPDHEVAAALAAIDSRGAAGAGAPVAVGTIPFTPGQPGQFVIPSVTIRKDAQGRCWLTRIEGAAGSDAAAVEQLTAARPEPTAQHFDLGPLTPVAHYLRAVEAARDAVAGGRLAKAVIARQVQVRSTAPIDVHAVLLRLRASFGSSYRYSIDGIVGASPELLVSVEGSTVRSHPLAGTAPRSGDPVIDARTAADLLASIKDQVEHRVVIDMIHDTLLPWCSYLDWEPEPSVVAVANVQHLATAMEGRLSDPRPNVLELVRALCPTPALGGFPREEALELIASVEGFDRGRYGGAVGWVDADGQGTFAVTIRCAEFGADRTAATLTAGGGIVARSEPLAELAETQTKFQAMLSAIVRP